MLVPHLYVIFYILWDLFINHDVIVSSSFIYFIYLFVYLVYTLLLLFGLICHVLVSRPRTRVRWRCIAVRACTHSLHHMCSYICPTKNRPGIAIKWRYPAFAYCTCLPVLSLLYHHARPCQPRVFSSACNATLPSVQFHRRADCVRSRHIAIRVCTSMHHVCSVILPNEK